MDPNKEPAEAIKEAELQASIPATEGTFLIVKQMDGNYIGYTFKGGKLVQVRQGDPQTVLTMLITDSGE